MKIDQSLTLDSWKVLDCFFRARIITNYHHCIHLNKTPFLRLPVMIATIKMVFQKIEETSFRPPIRETGGS